MTAVRTSQAVEVPATGRAVHRELVATPSFALPPLAEVVPGAVDETHDAPVTFHQLHHDTADRRLGRWGADLSVRLDGPDRGWRLVLPPDDDLDEIDAVTAPLRDDEQGERAPVELLDLVRALVREATVGTVGRTFTTRSTVHVVDAAGHELATVHDDRVEVETAGAQTRHERRLRICAAGPDPDAARAVARIADVLLAGSSTPEPVPGGPGTALASDPVGATSGPADGAALADAAGPDVVVPPRPHRHSSAGQVLTYALAVHVRELLLADVAVRRDRADAVHRLRVAARTVRSALRTFADLCDGAWATHLREELAVMAEALGAVRDTEVLYARLETAAGTLAAADRVRVLRALDAVLRPRLVTARTAALAELSSARYLHLVADLVDAVHRPRFTAVAERDAADVLPDLVTGDWDRLVHAVGRLRRGQVDPRDRAWHRARILAKRTRYGVEATAPCLRGRTTLWQAELPRLTDLLGEVHDGVVAAELLQHAAAGTDGLTGPALGRLLVIEDSSVDTAAAEFVDRWPHVRRRLERHPLR